MLDDLEFLESYLITEYDAEVVWGKDEEWVLRLNQ